MASKNGVYNITIRDEAVVEALSIMAIKQKNAGMASLIVKQMTAMAERGVTYLELLDKCEALQEQLREYRENNPCMSDLDEQGDINFEQ